ncbi:hypothetical protein [Psychrobium sp. 1_MG-2023]|uniref:hypothetical protein n=1 Tax=Psychrobium sp. 1_MG-2023 TaxID=3062624 RepID=UPI000C339C9B|nr:hypothetical protein [Psychrobium sp. 1_MG-2023]MDP2561188.1 hypothetical protein [Psychrobium sp. 1_MG-2023]PKF55307.1 hypothetical protein CW748_13910 [Alteromonadales bacterium alter-6D02]
MNFIRITTLAVALLASVGCKTSIEPRTISLQNNIKERTFEFKKLKGVGSNVTTTSSVKRAVADHIRSLSGFNNCRGEKCTNYISQSIKEYWGTSVHPINDAFQLTYYSGQLVSGNSDYRSVINVSFPYTITETDSAITVKLLSATSAVVKTVRNPVFMEIPALVTDDRLQHHLTNIMVKGVPVITDIVRKKGEFNVDFDPESVKTNFVRTYSSINFSNETNGAISSSYFKLYKDSQAVNTMVQVYLYRGQSKVEYKVDYEVSVKGNGTTDYDDGALLSEAAIRLEEVAKS